MAAFWVDKGNKGIPRRRNIVRPISEAGKSMVYPGREPVVCYYQKEWTDQVVLGAGER